MAPDPMAEQLRKADNLRTADPAGFSALLSELEPKIGRLPLAQQQYFQYLKGYQQAYAGNYDDAVPALKTLADESVDVVLRFRAGATVANILTVATRYEEAFGQLKQLLTLLPQVTDKNAREQGLSVIAYMYNQVGEYDLGLSYANQLAQQSPDGRGACSAAQLKLEALYKSTRLQNIGQEFQAGIDTCLRHQEAAYANVIRTYVARLYMDQGSFDETIALLRQNYDEVQRTRYPRLISEINSLLALAYRQTGDSAQARHFAQAAVDSGVPNQYTEPLVQAYHLLYLLAKERNDGAAALAYHEKYAAADRGYLDDVGARQLAYERVEHEATASKLQIDTLNTENRVLQLQRENNRLYIALLIVSLGFIVFFAYRTKRSQLYFKKLSQQDGLTGIANRPHFIAQAKTTLAASRRSQHHVCAVLCDLDHFKSINDRHGHAMGDYVLQQVVAACRAQLRPTDIFGRFGGEEFCILLPGYSVETAQQLCERLRTAIVGVADLKEDLDASVSASFGISSTHAFGYELHQLLAHADAALYQAKDAGRNRVMAYDALDLVALASIPDELSARVSNSI